MTPADRHQNPTSARAIPARIGTATTLLVLLAAALACASAPSAPPEPDPAPDPGSAKERRAEERSRPEVVYATKLVTPLSAMRYTLSREGSPEAKALADEVVTAMDTLRAIRLNPDAMTWEEMKSKTDAVVAKVEASKFASDPSITKSLERYRQFIAEYEAARAGTPE